MHGKKHALQGTKSQCAHIESLEPRAYFSVTFDGGRVANDRPSITSFTLARLNTDSIIDLGLSSTTGTDGTIGTGSGTFTFKNGKTVTGFTAMRSGDLNGDGKVDLYGAGSNKNIIAFYGLGDGSISSSQFQYGYGTASQFDFTTADMNADGLTDLVVGGSNGLKIERSKGNGTYTEVYTAPFTGMQSCIQAFDINGDGKRDMVFGISDGQGNAIGRVLQTSTGLFAFQYVRAATLAGTPLQIRSGFINSDAILDLVVLEKTGNSNAVQVLQGNGDGTFKVVDTVNNAATGITVADFDKDGHADVAVSNSAGLTIYRADQDGTVTYVPFTTPPGTPAGDEIDSADFNNDGKQDIIYRASDGQLRVYLNTTPKQNILRGILWKDTNQNQVKDSGESVLADKIIYDDTDDDGVLDVTESYTKTLADGRWELLVNDGTHHIRQRPDSGWVQSQPYGTLPQLPAAYTVTVSGGSVTNNLNFGVYDGGDIQGRVYNDIDGNGIRSQIEGGLFKGVVVWLDLNQNGDLDGEPTTITDDAGRYHFDVSSLQSYMVHAFPPGATWLATGPVVRTVTAGPNTAAFDVDFGFTQPATISGHVYYDYAANGRIDSEDVGQGGLQVFLDLNNNGTREANEPQTTSSNSSDPAVKGSYKFTGLYPKSYVVRVIKPAGYQQVSPAKVAAPNTDAFVTFAFGGSDTAYTDFGVIRPVIVSGKVWHDGNANGKIDTNEAGSSNFGVFIDYDGDGSADLNEPYVLSDSAGNYSLTSTRQGTFNVRVIKRSGLNLTSPSTGLYSVVFTYGAAATTGKNFGFVEGPFSTAPYQSPININTGSNPTALAVGDFNGDGKQDFIVASNSSVSQVFLGQGNGLFTPGQQLSIGDSTRYMIAVDVSGDGKPDLVAANEALDFGASVLIGNGNGTFKNAVNYAVTTNTYGVAAADFNGDGKKDLAYVGTTDGRVAILINKGTGAFNNATFVTNTGSFGAKSIAAADVNGDGKQDLVAANNSNDSLSVFLGNGSGGFTKVATNVTGGISQPGFIVLADFNKDGKQDVAALNEFGDAIRVKLGNGNGTFQTGATFATGETPTQVAVLDIDRDGKLDLIASCRSDGTTDISGGVSILRGKGDGTFLNQLVRTAHTSPTAVAIADYNGDGKLDIVAANFFSDDVSLLINGTPAATGSIRGVVWDDLNLDGVPQAGEAVLAGQTVFADIDNDGVYDAGERFTRTASDGTYAFLDLPPTTYRIRAIVPSNRVQTTPLQGAANVVNLGAGATPGGINLALNSIATPDGYVFDNRGAVLTGSWTSATGAGQYGGNYLHDGNTSKGSKTVRYDLKLPNAGYYAVQIRWVAESDRANNVPVDIKTATKTRTVTINQKQTGGTWISLGTYQFNPTGGTVTIRTAGTNGFVVADAIRLIQVSPPLTYIKDNADAGGATKTGNWLTQTSPPGFNGANYLVDGNPATKGQHSVKFTPTVAQPGVYEIFGRWVAAPDRATNARYDIVTASGVKTVFANQKNSGGQWVSLGFFEVNPATLSVTIRNDGADGLVVADAVKFVLVA